MCQKFLESANFFFPTSFPSFFSRLFFPLSLPPSLIEHIPGIGQKVYQLWLIFCVTFAKLLYPEFGQTLVQMSLCSIWKVTLTYK